MRRVYGVYFMRQLGKPVTRLTAFFAILLAVASSVSMPNVIHNTLHSGNMLAYVLSALAGTKSLVQIGVLLAGLLVVWAVVDIFRAEPQEARALA